MDLRQTGASSGKTAEVGSGILDRREGSCAKGRGDERKKRWKARREEEDEARESERGKEWKGEGGKEKSPERSRESTSARSMDLDAREILYFTGIYRECT